uniref:Transmembrane domain-containing protein n=1 Tax=Trepomonas sp. PC1 TaxID=1076344 RepID=A0A146KK28_9EUKA|eukprot:JAP96174.1 Transmembrane domain-containing protein [Trepomonas sp. PC1]
MFQFSSLLIFKYDSIVDSNEWWRPFSGIFTCNHPDTLMLNLFMLYISRSFEFYNGSVAYVFLVILAIIICQLPFLLLSIVDDQFKSIYCIEYTMGLPAALSTAAILAQFRIINWKAKLSDKISIPQGFGWFLVIFLAASHRFIIESVVIVLWSALWGGVLGIICKSTCSKYKKLK